MLETLLSKLTERRRETQGEYATLVRQLAKDEAADPDRAARTLDAAGKSSEDLARDVALVRERIRLASIRATRPQLEGQRRKLLAQLEAANRKLAAAEAEHEKTASPLVGELERVKACDNMIRDAESELMSTCPYRELTDAATDATKKIERLAKAIEELEEMNARASVAIDLNAREAAESGDRRLAAQLNESADVRRRETQERLHRIADFRKQIAELHEHVARLRTQMLEP